MWQKAESPRAISARKTGLQTLLATRLKPVNKISNFHLENIAKSAAPQCSKRFIELNVHPQTWDVELQYLNSDLALTVQCVLKVRFPKIQLKTKIQPLTKPTLHNNLTSRISAEHFQMCILRLLLLTWFLLAKVWIFRGTQRENFTMGATTPLLHCKCPFPAI